jgi:hypothetical protein
MNRLKTLETAIELVCGDRAESYGSVEDNFKTVAAFWSDYLGCDVWDRDVAAMMVLLKVARIKAGKKKDDNWVDIAGYASCGAELDDVP